MPTDSGGCGTHAGFVSFYKDPTTHAVTVANDDMTVPAGATGFIVVVENTGSGRTYFNAQGRDVTGHAVFTDYVTSEVAEGETRILETHDVHTDAASYHLTAAVPPLDTWGVAHALTFTVYWQGNCAGYCAYGTELTTSGSYALYLTPGLIDVILARVGMVWLTPFLTAYWFSTVNAQTLCSTGPPAVPDITLDDLIPPNLPKLHQALEAACWGYVCQCSAGPSGSPAPIAFPDPTLSPPTGLPAAPSLDCDDTSVCTVLSQLMVAITQLTNVQSALKQQIDTVAAAVTLIQREHVPFAYLPGNMHTGLTGAGTFDVQAVLGLSVVVTTAPVYLSADMEDPSVETYYFGDLSLGTADGYERKVRITHSTHLVLDVSAAVTTVAYTFRPGVEANVLELVREP